MTLKRYEVERLEGIAKQVTDELEGLRLETNTVARSASLQDAAEPVVKHGSRQWLRTGLAVAVPFLLVIGCVGARELTSRRIYGPDDARAAPGVRILGAVPRLAAGRREHAGAGGGGPDALTDALDAVCAAVFQDRGRGVPQVLMVTSAAPREGKSTLARNLAARLAGAGKKTLLVDADLYRPTAHAAYGLPAGPGLGEVLCGAVAAAVAVRPAPAEGLFVLTAGAAGAAGFRAVARGALGPVLADLRAGFDAVVIDTSPVLATTQPLLAGRHADAVVLSTLCTVSRSTQVAAAIGRLAEHGIPVAGVVVNGAAEASQYGYYFRPDPQTPVPATTGC